jgi:hypothetical protein
MGTYTRAYQLESEGQDGKNPRLPIGIMRARGALEGGVLPSCAGGSGGELARLGGRGVGRNEEETRRKHLSSRILDEARPIQIYWFLRLGVESTTPALCERKPGIC